MITITIPAWFVWLCIGLMCVSGVISVASVLVTREHNRLLKQTHK
jgi:heme exporter protein D